MTDFFDEDFGEPLEEYTDNSPKNEVYLGYVMLPCFKVIIRHDGIPEMVCGSVLGWIFEVFFAPFWSGKIHIYGKAEIDGDEK